MLIYQLSIKRMCEIVWLIKYLEIKPKNIENKILLVAHYCDESCHLESGRITHENRFMVLGGVMCYAGDKDEIFKPIKTIKKEEGGIRFRDQMDKR